MKHRSSWFGGLAAILIVLLGTATAAAYAGQVAGSVEISVGRITCNEPIAVTATVLDKDAQAIAGQLVHWEFASTPSTGDAISPSSTTTNARGVATSAVTLTCSPGTRQLRATADQVSGTAVLGLTEQDVLGGNGLPNTSAAPPSAGLEGGSLLILLAILAVLVAGGSILRRPLALRG